MDISVTDSLCTKHRLWTKKSTIKQLITYLEEQGMEFVELVLGEPNNFIFADEKEEIDDILKRKGYYGIRIKFSFRDARFEINSNNDGIDNVHYTIYADTNETKKRIETMLPDITSIIGPSNDTLANVFEFFATHRQVRNISILVLIAITLYFLGVYVFLFDLISILFSFSPFLAIYLLYMFFRRR